MKPTAEWTEGDLNSLITDQVKESLNLDYKNSIALDPTERHKEEISKDISSFANSDGGTVVYGISEEGHLPVAIDDGCDPTVVTRERLEQIIHSRIHPRIDGILINEIELITHAPGRVAYVVEVPPSPRAPHMSSDHRYYKRFNFLAAPMEDYEVRDVGRRIPLPILQLSAQETMLRIDSGGTGEANVQFRATNPSPITATFVVVTLGAASAAGIPMPHPDPDYRTWEWVDKRDDWKVVRCVVASGSSKFWSPITPGFTLMLPNLEMRIPIHEADATTSRPVALVRFDYDGGSAIYHLRFSRVGDLGERIRLEKGLGELTDQLINGMPIPSLFVAPQAPDIRPSPAN